LKVLLILLSCFTCAHATRLRVGDKTERFDVDLKKISTMSSIEQRIILSTVKVNNKKAKSIGSAVLLKEVDGAFYFLTNNHVLKNQKECSSTTVTALDNEMKRIVFKCESVVATKSKDDLLDYTVFTLRSSERLSTTFSGRAVGISSTDPSPGDQLITAGFGSQSFNEKRFDITMSNDDDCIMLAGPIEIKMQDYAMRNTIALGCDASSGDSGSGIFSRESGKLVGIFFGTAKTNRKNPELSTEELNKNIGDNNYFRNWSASSWATQLTNLNP